MSLTLHVAVFLAKAGESDARDVLRAHCGIPAGYVDPENVICWED